MSWRLEASGAKGANKVTIEPIESGDPEQTRVRIRVTSLNGEHPTMPIYPRGTVYRDRNGVDYTILNLVVREMGPDDGETSFWMHDYLALLGAHNLVGLHP
jgi:hypothetical protein